MTARLSKAAQDAVTAAFEAEVRKQLGLPPLTVLTGMSSEELSEYGGMPCSCKQDLIEAQAYIRDLENQIRELRDRRFP